MTRRTVSSSKPEARSAAETRPVQADPTRPRARDATGNEMDAWGLPLAGPLRAVRLAELGKPDPNVEPGAWSSADAGADDADPAASGTEE
ncbi:hypothetical protein [Sphingobium sp. IP1]|uniref:hypothetical protein n=1 Tax=Sphingobium sp. IP1 TaxID=2021637 RepID=UPI0015D4F01F|nr:hypothetical protein [Sphingobium sp. IP1]